MNGYFWGSDWRLSALVCLSSKILHSDFIIVSWSSVRASLYLRVCVWERVRVCVRVKEKSCFSFSFLNNTVRYICVCEVKVLTSGSWMLAKKSKEKKKEVMMMTHGFQKTKQTRKSKEENPLNADNQCHWPWARGATEDENYTPSPSATLGSNSNNNCSIICCTDRLLFASLWTGPMQISLTMHNTKSLQPKELNAWFSSLSLWQAARFVRSSVWHASEASSAKLSGLGRSDSGRKSQEKSSQSVRRRGWHFDMWWYMYQNFWLKPKRRHV